jgi:CxxC motif-containing protein (DUF1111 family)
MLYACERSNTEPFGIRPIFRPFRRRHLTAILGGATVGPNSTIRRSGRKKAVRTVLFLSMTLAPAFVVSAPDDGLSHPETAQAAARLGEELFHREWVAGDTRSSGGDGLGPVYNETSCVACHNLGGAGGAGPATKNVVVLTAVSGRTAKGTSRSTDGKAGSHPGFEKSASVSLHRFGTDPDYEIWRSKLLGLKKLPRPRRISDERTGNQRFGADPIDVSVALDRESLTRIESRTTPIRVGDVTATSSERNTTPLFGAGPIDAIPGAVIEAVAMEQANSNTSAEIHGRVSRLADGRIGRFGWKGQTASLEDFVLTACAVELGLEVPGHPQPSDPLSDKKQAPGLDLSAGECAALASFVAGLPRPVERVPSTKSEMERVATGHKLFKSIGCATCHRPQMGSVAGLYSDLLLHDMGPGLGGAGSYYNIPADSSGSDPVTSGTSLARSAVRSVIAGSQEWRTPPLWGVRDSGPYLHDGRASTLEQAIAMHGGEGEESAQAFAALEPKEKAMLMTFLKSLVAPTSLTDRREMP